MDGITRAENIGTLFICSVFGCYIALVLWDKWRQRRRRKRIEKHGRDPGVPVTLVVLKETDSKKNDLKQ